MCFGPSSIHLPMALRNAGSENASNKPVRRKICALPLTLRVPLKLTVRVSGSALILPSFDFRSNQQIFRGKPRERTIQDWTVGDLD